MKGKMKAWLFIAIAMLLMSACSKEEVMEEPEKEPDKVIEVAEPEEEEEEVEEVVPKFMSPFTGIFEEEENMQRPILVTINNHPLARPQSGISEADIVYEFIAEGNVTRLLAVFQSELPEQVGPVRSARDYFIHVAKGLDAFYVAHGYSPDALALLQKGYVDNINGMYYDGTLFKRSTDRKAPHNSYTSAESILLGAEKTNASMEISKLPSLSFHDSIESAKVGVQANIAVVHNGSHPNFTSTYMYDEIQNTYIRSVNDIVTIDKSNDEEVELSNILVFEAVHRTIDNVGRQSVDIETGGKAMLFQAGMMREIEWKNIDGILTPIEDGVPAKLVPGKTWIHIVPTKPGLGTSVTYTP